VREQSTKPPGAIDRRVARTRAALHQAHLALILEKGYDAMTVEDICAAANVGRSTFYAHFTDKQDLHRSGLEHLRRGLLEHSHAARATVGADRASPFAFSRPMFEHARDRLALYRALIGSQGGAVAIAAIREMLRELVRAELPPGRQDDGDPPREFTVRYLVGAYLEVLTWWLDEGAKLPPETMDAAFQRLATQGMAELGAGRADELPGVTTAG
jgi:AcrR family transcriptional regulator